MMRKGGSWIAVKATDMVADAVVAIKGVAIITMHIATVVV